MLVSHYDNEYYNTLTRKPLKPCRRWMGTPEPVAELKRQTPTLSAFPERDL